MNRDETPIEETSTSTSTSPLSAEEENEFVQVIVDGYELAKRIVIAPVLAESSMAVVMVGLATAYAFVIKRCEIPLDFASKLVLDRLKFVDECVDVIRLNNISSVNGNDNDNDNDNDNLSS